ncbi:hypothetical protein FACS189421_14400 [Bacteroidia bacterium]|nr:hypothetical protein FACS189421_14400 [Bacteroidia bacterium]
MKKMMFLMLTLLIWGAASMNAQVAIGGDKDPESFAVLELINGGTQGLRLPQLTAAQRTTLTAQLTGLSEDKKDLAKGLIIFNTTENCTETWNGTMWISDGTGPIVSALISGPVSGITSFNMFSYQTITLTANASGGSTPTAYQWYKDGVPVGGATASTYPFTPPTTANERDDYTFYCRISNEYSSNVRSNDILVTVEQATFGELKGIPLRKDNGDVLYIATQFLGQETATDAAYTGDLYQYGREADGHEKQNSPVTTTQATNSSAPYEPADVRGKFVAKSPWTTSSDNKSLWDNPHAQTNDPCPSGWHLPTYEEFLSILPKNVTASGSQYTSINFDTDKRTFVISDGDNIKQLPVHSIRYESGTVGTQNAIGGANEWTARFWYRHYPLPTTPGYTMLRYTVTNDSYAIQNYGAGYPVVGYAVMCVK